MVKISLKNGSDFKIVSLHLKGQIIDSNGTEVGGNFTFTFSESEVNALNAIAPIQTMYDAVFLPKESEQPESAE